MTATISSTLTEISDELSRRRQMRVLQVMHLSRAMDDKMAKLVKQNKGGTFQLAALGHEMIGAVFADHLKHGSDWACAYYRDQPLAVGLGCEIEEMFGVFMGRETERQSRGRMMPYHFSHKTLRMPTQSSVVGTQYLPAVGVAHGLKLQGLNEVVYVSGGDGSTSEGDFSEALNFAALHKLSVVFVIHDNGWAISVPVTEQVAGGSVAAAFKRPGLEVSDVDGTDYEALDKAAKSAVERARKGEGPTLVVANVPRLGSHSNSDDPRKYRPDEQLQAAWQRDPIARYEAWLASNGVSRKEMDQVKEEAFNQVDLAAKEAALLPFPSSEDGDKYVFAKHDTPLSCPIKTEGDKIVMVDAINSTLREEMAKDESVVIFGEDVAHGKGGVFGVTRGLTEQYGVERCFNTPLAEATVVGLAIGLALDGRHKPVGEIQFADYLWPGFDLLASEAASIHYRSGGEWNVPMVLRMPYGGYIQGGPYHSQSIEGILAHCPGLKVVIPSNSADAKGLLRTAIHDPNPVIFLEHKALYRQAKFCARPDPGPNYYVPFGKAAIVREGSDLTFVGWGMMVVMAMDLAAQLAADGIDMEVIDLRTIVPADMETVIKSVKKSGKLIVAHEAARNCGFGAELAAQVAEEAFEYLDGPITRVCGLDAAIPYSKPLENAVLPQLEDLDKAIRELHRY